MSIRSKYFLGFILVAALLLISIYLQFIDGVLPCPLCAFQRVAFVLLGFFFLIGIFIYQIPVLRYIVNILAVIASGLGIILAGRQIWLQHFPPANHECSVSLQYMLHTFPINEVMKKIFFEGTAECTQGGWQFLHLNMAEWSLIWFVIFLVLSISLFFTRSKQQRLFANMTS